MHTTKSGKSARSRRLLPVLIVSVTAFGTALAGALPGPAGGAAGGVEAPRRSPEEVGAADVSAASTDTAAPVAVSADGTTRVIVGLDAAQTPEHELDARGAFAQRVEIAVAQDDLADELSGTDATVVREIDAAPYSVVEASPEVLDDLENSPIVTSVEPDRLLEASLNSTTPLVGADAAQAEGYDGTGATVAVLDTGVDRTHPYLSGRVVREACFSYNACPNRGSAQTGTGSARPCSYGAGCWHGTHVTGIAAGKDQSGGTYTGVAPGADIFAIQVFSPVGGYVLDRWGTLHAVGVADEMSGWSSGGFPAWDIARSFALRDSDGGYILDAWGGLHRAGDAPALGGGPYWKGWDIARGLVLRPDGNGGYVMDGWGGLHRVGNAPPLSGAPYWSGWDIARDVALHPDGGGYTLDGWGGIHEWGGAPKLAGGPYWKGWDIARGLELTADGTGAWIVDAWGGRHAVGTAPSLGSGAYWPGWNIARDVAAVPEATAYTSDLLAALSHVYAQRNTFAKPIASVNMSLGGGLYPVFPWEPATCNDVSPSVTTVLSNLRSAKIAPVAASGNQGSSWQMNFPGCVSHAVSVGATNDSDAIASYSNSGSALDLFAPGQSVVSSVPDFWSTLNPPRGSSNGTSMATPHVAGAFAVLRDKAPAASVSAMLTSLKSHGPWISWDLLSRRRLQLDEALDDF
ncbi:MAG: S8 family serine peptidase [Acidimicrobiia bacterium]|nr:S8 family serine peptidase [Acidimicrobiia bacterium]